MLGPLLEALWQEIGPAVQQLLKSLAPYANKVPRYVYYQAAHVVADKISEWYQGLSAEEKRKLDNAIHWVVKDLTADVVTAYTGLPIGPLVEKVLDKVKEHKDSEEARSYVSSELSRQLAEAAENKKVIKENPLEEPAPTTSHFFIGSKCFNCGKTEEEAQLRTCPNKDAHSFVDGKCARCSVKLVEAQYFGWNICKGSH